MSFDPVPGMRVVCISDRYKPGGPVPCGEVQQIPQAGRVYTIRGVRHSGHIWLVEVVNKPEDWATGFHEYAFHPARFRPIDERCLDVFREALKKAPSPRERVQA